MFSFNIFPFSARSYFIFSSTHTRGRESSMLDGRKSSVVDLKHRQLHTHIHRNCVWIEAWFQMCECPTFTTPRSDFEFVGASQLQLSHCQCRTFLQVETFRVSHIYFAKKQNFSPKLTLSFPGQEKTNQALPEENFHVEIERNKRSNKLIISVRRLEVNFNF